MEDLVLLAVRETESGWEEKLQNVDLPFPKVGRVDWDGELADLTKREGENKEGFVIRYESGLRLKIKFSEYVRLHKLDTRKDQAGLIRGSNKYSGVAFAMLDGKNYQKIIWDIVRPVTAKPFIEEAEIERRAKL